MTDTYQANPRTISGKALKTLRREGILPASIYGRGLESLSVQLNYTDARDLMNAHGYNSLISINVAGESETRPVMVKKVAQDPMTRELRHIDFLQVDLKRKISGPVSVHLVGEAPVVLTEGAVIVTSSDTLEVEALPGDMPESLELSLDSLTSVDQSLFAKDVNLPAGVTLVTDPEHLMVAVTRSRVASDSAADEAVTTEAVEEAAAEAAESTDEEKTDEAAAE